MIELTEVLPKVKSWARKVGQLQRKKSITRDFEINTKSSETDLVTEIDGQSEKYLIENIDSNFPGHSVLGEEGGTINRDSDYVWIIDPLDGTNNYANGLPLYSVSLALKYKNELVLGLIYAPELGEMFTAIKGEGAYLNGDKLSVSSKHNLKNCIIATGFPYDKLSSEYNNFAPFISMVKKTRGVRRIGSAAYDLANVAAGRLDGFWEFKLNPWDIAAGKLLIEEAGGKVIDTEWEGVPLIVSGNETICNQLYSHLEEITEGKAGVAEI